MQISKITSVQSFGTANTPKKRFNYVKATGYGIIAAGALCAFSYKKRKPHKYLAMAAGLLTVAHVGILEFYRLKSVKKQS